MSSNVGNGEEEEVRGTVKETKEEQKEASEPAGSTTPERATSPPPPVEAQPGQVNPLQGGGGGNEQRSPEQEESGHNDEQYRPEVLLVSTNTVEKQEDVPTQKAGDVVELARQDASNRDPYQPEEQEKKKDAAVVRSSMVGLDILTAKKENADKAHISSSHAPPQEPKVVPATASSYALVLQDLVLASGRNKILRGVDMAVPTGQLTGILGESGAGKTTLLRLVARKLDESVLTITGAGFLPKEIWYIAQEDVLYEHDTPRRCVSFLHKLLYGGGSHIDGEENVDANIVAEDLLELVRFPMDVIDRPVGTTDDGLSVGSRRLLNVAMAICARAKVVMLDEPTTGLDSTTAANLVKTIAEVCHDTGLTAICTIHQPADEALQHFDSLTVMSEGQAFVPNPDAPTTEKWADAADYSRAELLLLQMKSRVLLPSTLPKNWTPEEKREIIGTIDFETQLKQLNTSDNVPPLGRQCVLLLQRFWVRNWANVFSFRFRMVISMGLATTLGFCFYQLPYDDPTFLRDQIGFYTAVIGTTFVPIVISAGFFPAEKPSFVHEMSQSKRPSLFPYLLTRSIYDVLVAVLASLFFFITLPIVGVPDRWVTFWFTLVLQSFCSDSFGLVLSIRFEPSVSIGALIPAIGFPGMLMGTGLVSPPKEGLGWIFHIGKWATFFKYGFTGMLVEQFPLMTGSCTPYVDKGCVYSDWQNAMDVNAIDRTEHAFVSSYGFNWMMLGIIYFIFRAIILVQLNGLVAASKFSYKSATNWEEKVKKDQERVEVDPGVVALSDQQQMPTDAHITIVEKEEDLHSNPDQDSDRRKSFLGDMVKSNDVTLTWDLHVVASHRVGLLGRKTETILASQTGYALSGEVLGILGPGSSGKTALLKVLSRMLPISGYEADQSSTSIRCDFNQGKLPSQLPDTRFVYQYDAFVPGDTVTSAVTRQLELAMNNPQAVAESCSSILKSMGLGHIVDKKAVEISGGQMRRLSIACQIAHSPRILFLDEPTSGLDSELALECMEALRRFAINSNAIVICTLNQPGKRLLPTVDRFIFMQQGDAVFEGTLAEGEVVFGATAAEIKGQVPTDVILTKLRAVEISNSPRPSAVDPPTSNQDIEEGGDQAVAGRGVKVGTGTQQSSVNYKGMTPPCPRNFPDGSTGCFTFLHAGNAHDSVPSGFGPLTKRIGILLRRNLASRITDSPGRYIAEMSLKLLVFPFSVAIMFAQVEDPAAGIRFAVSFMVLSGICFTAMVSPVVVLAAERVVYERERRASDYSPITYIIARWIFEFLPEALFALVGFGVFFLVVGFDGSFGLFYATMMMAFYACVGLALAVAVIPMPVFVNCGIAAFSLIIFFLSANFLVTPSQVERTWFLHLLEPMNPMRAAGILQFLEETSTTAVGTKIATAQFGVDRAVIDEEYFLWATLVGTLVVFRLSGIMAASFLHWLDTAIVRKMHPEKKK